MLNSKLKLTLLSTALLISLNATAADPDKKGMTLWLDASDATSLFTDKACTTQAIATGDVSCWQDKSGKDNHVKKATNVTNSPKKLDKNLNDKAVVEFIETALVTDDKDQITPNSSYTKFVVFKLNNEDGSNGTSTLGKHNLIGSDPYQTTLWADNGNLHSQHVGTDTNYLDSKEKLGITKYHIGVTRFSKPDDKKNPDNAIHNILNLDGKRVAHNDNDDGGKDGKLHHKAAKTSIGGVGKDGTGENNFYLHGAIAEAIIYDRSLSDTEITTVEKYLAKKWKLPLGQNITFDKPKNQVKGNPAIQLHATSSSGIKVIFTSKTTGICKIISAQSEYVSLDSIGTCKIEANAAKDDAYPKAAPITQTFKIKSVKDDTTEAPATDTPAKSSGGGGGSFPIGLALLGLLTVIRRKLS